MPTQEKVPKMLATTLNAFPHDNEYANMSKSKEQIKIKSMTRI